MPRGEIVDGALIVKTGVRSEVGLYIIVVVGSICNRISSAIDDARHQTILVVFEDFLDSGAKEAIVRGAVASTGETFTSEVASKDLFLEVVWGTRDAFKVFKDSHCAGNGGALRALGEDGVGCRRPVGGWNVVSTSLSACNDARS